MEKFLSTGSSDENKNRNAEKELNKMKKAISRVENFQEGCTKQSILKLPFFKFSIKSLGTLFFWQAQKYDNNSTLTSLLDILLKNMIEKVQKFYFISNLWKIG